MQYSSPRGGPHNTAPRPAVVLLASRVVVGAPRRGPRTRPIPAITRRQSCPSQVPWSDTKGFRGSTSWRPYGRWLGRGRSCASSTPSEKPTFTRKQPVREPRPLVSTYASLPVVALAPTTRVRSISHLASPAGACLQVLTTCRSAASRRASAAVRALREPTCLSIV